MSEESSLNGNSIKIEDNNQSIEIPVVDSLNETKELYNVVTKSNRNYHLTLKFEHKHYYAGEEIRGLVELSSNQPVQVLPSIILLFKINGVVKIRGLIKDKCSVHYEVHRRFVPKKPVELKLQKISDTFFLSDLQSLTVLPTCLPSSQKGECGPKGETEYEIKYQVNVYLRDQPTFFNLASILGRMKLKSKIQIYPTPLYQQLKEQKKLKIVHQDQSQSPYRFKATFFKNVYVLGEEVVFRISFRSDIKPYITSVITSLESIISLFGINKEGEQKCVQRYEENPEILHSFDIEKETREKSEEEYEVTFTLNDSILPSVVDSNDWIIKRDYSISVRAECGEAETFPIVYHDIQISAPLPDEKYRRVIPPKEIKAYDTVLKEEKFEPDGNDFFGGND